MSVQEAEFTRDTTIKTAPRGLAILAIVGPSMVWCAEYIGSGEVILSTRTGAILGIGVIWAIVVGIFLKYWIGMSGARYTVCTGEGMIDMIGRMPGPRNWGVWIVLVAQLGSAAISIGSIAAAGGVFLSSLVPISPHISGWLITVFALGAVWSGLFDILKIIMSMFVAVIVIGVLYVTAQVFPGIPALLGGLVPEIPAVPEWALSEAGVHENPWREILPLLGWAAGGFASQVWYTYWVLGAGYGAAQGKNYGEPADEQQLQNMTRETANKIKGWCRVVYTDATIAMIIGTVITVSFLIAGAGVLGPNHLAPDGPEVAIILSTIFSSRWGEIGGFLFLLAGTAAMIGTQIGQMAGWPRLLADTFRLCIPGFKDRFAWKTQFRMFLLLFLATNMVIVYEMGLEPVFLVKLGAVLDGLLLTPLQALWIGIGLYVVMPRLLSSEAYEVLRPHWIFGVGLTAAFLVFGYFCIFQIPYIL
jgi:Mn2+/Fe2+ NRAMP family transporter